MKISRRVAEKLTTGRDKVEYAEEKMSGAFKKNHGSAVIGKKPNEAVSPGLEVK